MRASGTLEPADGARADLRRSELTDGSRLCNVPIAPVSPPWPVVVTTVSPVSAGSVLWSTGGRRLLTFVVKATFDLTHGEPARLTSPLPLLREDTDGAPSDLGPYLPSVGVMVKGHAAAPGGQAVHAMAVRLAIYRDGPLLDKTLHVFGDRAGGAAFTRMPLVWERARGGPEVDDNPVGMSAHPHVIDPRHEDKPGGLAPVPRSFPSRQRRRGAASAERVDGPTPELPMGFDWRYFQAAPPDQQLRPLRGDEWVVLDGFDADLPRIQSRLPAAKASVQVTRAGEAPRVLDLTLDTIFVDADRRLLVLVYRDHILLEGSPSELSCAAGLALPGAPIAWSSSSALPQNPPARPARVRSTLMLEAMPELKDPLPFKSAPATPASDTPAPPRPPPVSPPAPPIRTGTLEIDLRKVPGLVTPFPTRAPQHAPPALVAAPAPIVPVSGAGVDPHEISAPEPPARLGPLPISTGEAPLPHKAPPPPPPPRPPRDEALRARVIAALRAHEPLTDLPLSGADLSDLDLSGALLAGCDLKGTCLSRSTLDDASLAGADLRGADLTEGVLVMADLSFANLQGAYIARARFDGARLTGADLTSSEGAGASFVAASAARAAFAKGTFRGAVFDEIEGEGVDFAGAGIDEATFRGATLAQSRFSGAHGAAIFDGAKLHGARAAGARLSQSSFARADLGGSEWTGAEIERATFSGATLAKAALRRARCDGAKLDGADLGGADLEESSLDNANLDAATLDAANLRRARLSGASLRGAKARGAMAYKADLSGADLSGADFEGTNLRASILTSAKRDTAKLEAADLRGAG